LEVPKFSAEEQQAFEARLRRMLGYDVQAPSPRTTRFDAWEARETTVDGDSISRLWVLGRGTPRLVEFDAEAREAAINWLGSDDSAWLDGLRLTFPPGEDVDYPEHMPDMQQATATLVRLFNLAGDLGMGVPVRLAGQNRHAVDVYGWAYRLWSLRAALMMALARLGFEISGIVPPSLGFALEARDPGPVSEAEDLYDRARDMHAVLGRFFILSGMEWLISGRLVAPHQLGEPFGVAPGSVSPLHEVFFVIALSVGALDPPYPLPGVYRCAYHRCQRVFLSKKIRVSGKLRFCCPEHGKRFYAARRMKEKAARARNASPTPEE